MRVTGCVLPRRGTTTRISVSIDRRYEIPLVGVLPVRRFLDVLFLLVVGRPLDWSQERVRWINVVFMRLLRRSRTWEGLFAQPVVLRIRRLEKYMCQSFNTK